MGRRPLSVRKHPCDALLWSWGRSGSQDTPRSALGALFRFAIVGVLLYLVTVLSESNEVSGQWSWIHWAQRRHFAAQRCCLADAPPRTGGVS
ncbi:hypothetical protein N7510_005297 [Penicillium lagena]|uniref:uncharacterized protein n=1 Tax=Penicillium lagena TaxID=94218 RepID=UPI0025405292|nr:uncharacterized protein N7510_005297 [Penicillium lagena]KAJ5612103.1 hypothetical protein N7510_005297 [Penicillium lagena]